MRDGAGQLLTVLGVIAALAITSSSHAAQLTVASDQQINGLLDSVDSTRGISVILIPGILGSKLTVREGAQTKVIWGGLNVLSDLTFEPSQNVTASIFDRLDLGNFVRDFGYNVYGSAITNLRDISPDGRTKIEAFPYDWRASNETSANKLQDWLCANSASLKTQNIIFVAHSMGGIVLKDWFKRYWETGSKCPDSATPRDSLNIVRIFLVGTPQTGAPKFADALVSGYSLTGSHGPIDEFLSRGLNKYGPTFESIYELIPIVQSDACRREKQINTTPYIFLRPQGMAPVPVDLFKAEEWKTLGMPRETPSPDYYTQFLPTQLERAERLLCG